MPGNPFSQVPTLVAKRLPLVLPIPVYPRFQQRTPRDMSWLDIPGGGLACMKASTARHLDPSFGKSQSLAYPNNGIQRLHAAGPVRKGQMVLLCRVPGEKW